MTGEVIRKNDQELSFSDAFGTSVLNLAAKHNDVVAITAAMCSGTGLNKFAEKYPDRFFDVGIAEGHGMVFAAGLAVNGLRPVYVVYATFLQRAMASLYHDICIQNLPVIICTDRSGIVDDGPTHHGIYDLSYLRALPNLAVIYPSSLEEMEYFMELAYQAKTPIVIKYPKASIKKYPIEFNKENYSWGKSITLKEGNHVSIWTTGAEFTTAFKVAEILMAENIDTEIVNSIFIKPFDTNRLVQSASSKLVVTIEDNSLIGGLASIVDEILINQKNSGVLHFGWTDKIIAHGTVQGIKAKEGLTPERIAEKIQQQLSKQQ